MTRTFTRRVVAVACASLIALAGCSAQPQADTSATDDPQAAEAQSGATMHCGGRLLH